MPMDDWYHDYSKLPIKQEQSTWDLFTVVTNFYILRESMEFKSFSIRLKKKVPYHLFSAAQFILKDRFNRTVFLFYDEYADVYNYCISDEPIPKGISDAYHFIPYTKYLPSWKLLLTISNGISTKDGLHVMLSGNRFIPFFTWNGEASEIPFEELTI